jgi:hypothetical protein
MDAYLTLREALESNRLDDFIAQAEEEGVEAANRELFDEIVQRVTAPQPAGQTSRSRGGGSKRGK